jgi:hypothetical protein
MPSRPTDFDGRRRLKALRTSESEVDSLDRESDDRKSAEKIVHAVIVEEAVKVHSKSLCNFTWLGKTVSINLNFNRIFFS